MRERDGERQPRVEMRGLVAPVGLAIGLVTGYMRRLDAVMMRVMDGLIDGAILGPPSKKTQNIATTTAGAW